MENPYAVVRAFEKTVAEFAGAKYGVSVESCCAAIFLSLKYCGRQLHWDIEVPKHTYPGVPMAVINAGYKLKFVSKKWKGIYTLNPLPIIDSAVRFRKGMYEGGFHCLSFHAKKHLNIGRGGMILTDDKEAVEWLKMARFDGRREIGLMKDNATIIGWNMYMTPEQASRGLQLFDYIRQKPDLPDLTDEYPNLSKWSCFKEVK